MQHGGQKRRLLENMFLKKGAFFFNFSRSSRARAGPIWALMGPYGPEKSRQIHKKLTFMGDFKVPCTLP